MVAAVAAPVHPLLCPRIYDGGVVGMHEQRPDLRIVGKSVRNAHPLIIALGASEHPAIGNVLSLACQSNVNMSPMPVRSHCGPPLAAFRCPQLMIASNASG